MDMTGHDGIVKTYKAARVWKIFSIIFMLVMTALFVVLPLLLYIHGEGADMMPFIIPFSCFVLLLGAYFVVAVFVFRIETTQSGFRQIEFLIRPKEVLFSKYQRFRILNLGFMRIFQFLPKDPMDKKIDISMAMENSGDFLSLIEARFVNTDKETVRSEDQKVSRDIDMNKIREEHPRLLKLAKPWSLILNITTVVAGLMALFIASPYELLVWTLTLLPITSILSVKFFKGVIRFDGVKGSIYPTVIKSFLAPPICLLIRAIFDASPLNHADLIAPSAGTALIFGLLCFFIAKETREKVSNIAVVCIVSIIFGYSTTALYNELLDTSNPTTYDAQVLNKRESGGDNTMYHLALTPWGPNSESADVAVDEVLFNSVASGDKVSIYLMAGRFNAPWIVVDKKE